MTTQNVGRVIDAIEDRLDRNENESDMALFRRWLRSQIVRIVRKHESKIAAAAIEADEDILTYDD